MKKLLGIFSILLFILSACSVTNKSIEVKIIDETGHNKYCGCSPCECGECKCSEDYPFPGYQRTK